MQDLLIEQLKNIKTEARAEWKDSTRDFLMSEISTDRYAEINLSQNNFFENFKFVKFAWRPVGVFALVVMFFMGSSGLIVAAAQNSTSGERMFVVKKMIEKSQGLMMTNSSQRVELASALLGNRVDELQKVMVEESQLIAADSNRHSGKVVSAVVELGKQLDEVDSKLKDLKAENKDNKKTAVTALMLNEKIRNYKDELKQMKEKVVDTQVDDRLVVVLDQIGEINNDVLEVIIDKQQKGELEIDNKEIESKLADHVLDIEEKVGRMEQLLVDNIGVGDTDFIERTSEAKKKIEDAREAIAKNEFSLVLTLAKGSNDILKILYGEIYEVIKNNEAELKVDTELVDTDNINETGKVEGVETDVVILENLDEEIETVEELTNIESAVVKPIVIEEVIEEKIEEFGVGIK